MAARKKSVGITIVGRDREGVVAEFTAFVFERGGNVERVSQNVVKGLFGMYLEASFPARTDPAKLDPGLQKLGRRLGMEVSTYHESAKRKRIAVFVTREPHCLEELLRSRSKLKGEIAVIVGTEKALAPLARRAKIPFVAVEERDQEKAEARLISICKRHRADLILLARYMRILTPNFVWRYPERIINIHPSLLPAFPGAIAYAQAFERGTKIAGVTAHYVTENLDQGPIIAQRAFDIRSSDTLESVKKKGQQLEARTLLEAARLHLGGKLEVRWRKVVRRR